MQIAQTWNRAEFAPARRTRGSSVRRAASQTLATVLGLFARWQQRAKTRRQLALLDDRLALDIGLDPEEVRHELQRPFWRRYAIARLAELERTTFARCAR